MHSTESRFVIGLIKCTVSGVNVCTFQPRHFTGWAVKGLIMIITNARVKLTKSVITFSVKIYDETLVDTKGYGYACYIRIQQLSLCISICI